MSMPASLEHSARFSSRFAVCLALLAILPVAAWAQQADPYQDALALFRAGRYARAVELLQPALQGGGLGAHRASGWLLLAGAHLGTDSPEAALQALASLAREFPDGPYLIERRWLAGRAHARAGRYLEGAREYAAVVVDDPGGRLGEAAWDALAGIVTGPMAEADLQRLGFELRGTDLKARLVMGAVEAIATRGELARARRILESLENEAPEGGYGFQVAAAIDDLRQRLTEAAPAGLVLGVLLPLTGPDAAEGQEIMNAVRLAVAQAGGTTELVWRDTGGSLFGTVGGAISLLRTEGVHALIGPYVDELALVAAGQAELMDTPIILPFTQNPRPASLGDHVFQLQATSRIQARFLADAAVDSLGMRTFAVLNPVSAGGPDFADAFMTRVEEKGGSVIAHQVYYPEMTDFQLPLDTIRREALRLSLLDTSDVALDDLAALEAANRDTLGEPVEVGSLDALVVPGHGPIDAYSIAFQTVFINLRTTLLGSATWNDFEILRVGQAYVNGTLFTDAYSIGFVSPAQVAFANAYYAAYSRQPGRTATFAYDAATLALNAWRMAGSGADGPRSGIRRWLTGVEGFEGASGSINFTRAGRINDRVYLLQIRDQSIQPWHR